MMIDENYHCEMYLNNCQFNPDIYKYRVAMNDNNFHLLIIIMSNINLKYYSRSDNKQHSHLALNKQNTYDKEQKAERTY